MKEERFSNFELLRIISMFLIVVFHSFGATTGYYGTYGINKVIYYTIGSWGILGVCCFVFITGWFSVKKDYVFKLSKVLKITLETIFYSLIGFIISVHLGVIDFNYQTLSDAILFFFSDKYWFVTTCIILMMLIPTLNKFIFSLKKNEYRKIIVILTIIVGIYKTFVVDASIDNILYFVYLYLLIGYLKLNPNNFFEKNSLKGFIMMIIFSVSITQFIFYVNSHVTFINDINGIEWFSRHGNLSIGRYNIFSTLCACFLFYIFKNIKINSNLINFVAKSTFGVYLIHENRYKSYLWNEIFNLDYYINYRSFIPIVIISCSIVYIVCTIIDILRIYLLERPIVDKILKKFNFSKIDNFINLKD